MTGLADSAQPIIEATPRVAYNYAKAVLIFLLALMLRLLALPVEQGLSFTFFIPAAGVAFYLCGLGPGFLTVALGGAAGQWITMQGPGADASPPWLQQALKPFTYFLVAIGTGMSTLYMRGLVSKLRSATLELATRADALTRSFNLRLEAICRCDMDGKILFANDAFCFMFGRPLVAVQGQQWDHWMSPEDKARTASALGQLSFSTPTVSIELRMLVGQAREPRWYEFFCTESIHPEARKIERLLVGRDISQHRLMRAQSAAAVAHWSDLYDNAPVGYFSLDAWGDIVNINDTTLRWANVKRESIGGQRRLEDLFIGDVVEVFRKAFVFAREGHLVCGVWVDLDPIHGRTRRVSLEVLPKFDSSGNFVQSKWAMTDVTPRHLLDMYYLGSVSPDQSYFFGEKRVGMVKLLNRTIIWNNAAAESMLGYSSKELTGQSARILHVSDTTFHSIGKNAYPTLNIGGYFGVDLEMACKDGTPRWISMSGMRLDHEPEHSIWFLIDISDLQGKQPYPLGKDSDRALTSTHPLIDDQRQALLDLA